MTLQELHEAAASHVAITQRLCDATSFGFIDMDEIGPLVDEQHESHNSLVDAIRQYYVSDHRG